MNKLQKNLFFVLTYLANHIWIGIVLILLGIVFEEGVSRNGAALAILINFLKSIGLAVVVAGLFSYVTASESFLKATRNQLQAVVASRSFLRDLNKEGKRHVLNEIMHSSETDRDIPNMESYIQHYINKTLHVARENVRSNYCVSCHVSYSSEDRRLVAEYCITYRLYPSETGYEDIVVGHCGEGADLEMLYEKVRVFLPNGVVETFGSERLKECEFTESEEGDETLTIPISEIASDSPHVNIELQLLQKGNDHWIQVGIQAQQPTDGLYFNVRCEEPLVIRAEETFVYGVNRSKDPPQLVGKRAGSIACQQWVEQGSGVTMLVGIEHSIDDETHAELSDKSHYERVQASATGETDALTAAVGTTPDASTSDMPAEGGSHSG